MSRDAKAASRFRGLLASERNSADLYSGLADAATGERRKVLTELAAVERRHAAHWAAKLTELGEPVPPADRPGLRTAVLSWLARRFSVDAVLPYLERAEHADAGLYQGDPDASHGDGRRRAFPRQGNHPNAKHRRPQRDQESRALAPG